MEHNEGPPECFFQTSLVKISIWTAGLTKASFRWLIAALLSLLCIAASAFAIKSLTLASFSLLRYSSNCAELSCDAD